MNRTEGRPSVVTDDRPLTLVDAHAHAWSPRQARTRFRAGLTGPTSGVAAGHTQANLISVPADWAYDMLLFCQRNPKPCPVLDVTDAGSWTTVLADGADLRTDLPRYRVWRDGELVDEPTDVRAHWRGDLVSFLIGCSFTFESALSESGVPIRHDEQGRNVPMYVTGHACRPAGRLHGPMVVSMRPVPPEHLADRRSGRAVCCPRCTAAPYTAATPRPSVSTTSPAPTSATRWTPNPATSRCSGPAVSPRRPR